MSIQASFATLQTLQVVDLRIAKLEAELATERAGISDKAERQAALLSRISKVESIVAVMESTRHELNQELRQHLLQVDKTREKLARCRNEREANAAQREMEEVRRLCKERETEIQKLLGLIADARADVALLEQERNAVAEQIDELDGQAALRVRALESSLEEQQGKREAALGKLPTTVQGRYHAVHARRSTGTAAAVDGSCTACHISLSPMLYQELMRMQEFFQCPSCHRLLYLTDAPEELQSDLETQADLEAQSDLEDDDSAVSEG
ncbi:MAG TPA: C4-type zinc ribbon domain-containing protein [Polyangiaceae bacterium]|nr:C4-type zinc ribbon domain-containing protein [Polyangiaceae bacterium]